MDTARLYADEVGLWLRGAHLDASVLSVSFDGRRVWSPGQDDLQDRDGGIFLAWPDALAQRLRGTTTVTLSQHDNVIASSKARFGKVSEPLQLTDRAGRGLAVNKWGRLQVMFDARDDDFVERLMNATEHVIELVQRDLGLRPYIISGTLLGAMRGGKLIGHDDDVDLAYLSTYTNPSDILLERHHIERVLRDAGLDPIPITGGHLQITFWKDGVKDFYVDLFTHFVLNGYYNGPFHIRVPADEVTIYPLRDYELEGHTFPGPADADAFLTANYNKDWHVPDPSYAFNTPAAAFLRFGGWFDHTNSDREDWDNYYDAFPGHREPSSFARFVEGVIPQGSPVIDLGCGVGDDASYFAAHGHHVEAIDYSYSGVTAAKEFLAGKDVEVHKVNLNEIRHVAAAIRPLLEAAPHPTVYARRLIDSTEHVGRETLFWMLRALLAQGGSAWLEFRPEEPNTYTNEPPMYPMYPDGVIGHAGHHGLVAKTVERTIDGDVPVIRLELTRKECSN